MVHFILQSNKECKLSVDASDKATQRNFLIIEGENDVTEITVTYPEKFKTWAKRVDFSTETKAMWTVNLEGFMDDLVGKTEFSFTLPSEVTIKGYLRMAFKAFNNGKTFVWDPIALFVSNGYAGNKLAIGNPDLECAAYEYAKKAYNDMNNLLQSPDCTAADKEGNPQVNIASDGRLQFVSIRGSVGKTGPAGKDGMWITGFGIEDDGHLYGYSTRELDSLPYHIDPGTGHLLMGIKKGENL